MTFVVIGSCELPVRGAIEGARQERSSSVGSEARLQTERRILSGKRMDDLHINLAVTAKTAASDKSKQLSSLTACQFVA
jgi:hypothetical protein